MLAFINGSARAREELAEIKAELGKETGTFRELLQPGVRYALVVACILMIFQQVNGVNMMLLYASKILVEAGGAVQEAIDMAWDSAGQGRQAWGETVPCEMTHKMAWTTRSPVGIAGLITPWNFPVGGGRVIAGWDQGLLGMKVGGRRKLTIPSHLAYGERGAGGVIKPGESLIFVVDLVAVR